MEDDAIQLVAKLCKAKLDLANASFSDEASYRSLPLCVIDAIFSINANYKSTQNTVTRFCEYFGISELSQIPLPTIAEQLSMAEFISYYEQYGSNGMAEQVYQNRQRTSTRSGILKSEAVLRFGKILHRFRVNYFQDIYKILGNPSFENAIKQIPGQGSGISLRYFYMLTGSEAYVKPDRMITRFIESAIGKTLSIEESHSVIVGACAVLSKEYPRLTPRKLDNLIWQYQRRQ